MSKKWLAFALKFALSGLLIWYLLSKIDLAAAWERVLGVAPVPLALAAGLMLLQIVLGSVRWLAVLDSIAALLPFRRTLEIFYIAGFFNQVLPSSVGGDAVRMWLARRAGLSMAGAINGVMLERLVTVFGLVLLVALTQPLLYSRISDPATRMVFPLLTLGGVVGIVVLMLMDRAPARVRHLKIVRGLAKLAADTRLLFLKPLHALRALLLAILGHVNLSIATYVLAVGLDIEVGLVDCLVLVPPVILITTLPISIAGWGVRETAMVTAFGFVGVAADSALVLSILLGLLNVAVCLPGGLIWLLSGERRAHPDAAREIEAIELDAEADIPKVDR
ncbi:MAG: flippase-like domain-containing protein [Rhodospirillales bacterium]|nr:flippase-like domain-containing protein [Rhodospirillales bacterium]